MIKRFFFIGFVGTLLSFLVLDASVSAQSTPYFQGKPIMLIQGREPAGTGALRVQAAIPLFKKYLPGEPIIVTQLMPGAAAEKRPIMSIETLSPMA
jgi:hypothetical protein